MTHSPNRASPATTDDATGPNRTHAPALMNAYELAEITAALAHHGMASQCHIQMNVGAPTVIYNGNDRLAIIRERAYGDYIAVG